MAEVRNVWLQKELEQMNVLWNLWAGGLSLPLMQTVLILNSFPSHTLPNYKAPAILDPVSASLSATPHVPSQPSSFNIYSLPLICSPRKPPNREYHYWEYSKHKLRMFDGLLLALGFYFLSHDTNLWNLNAFASCLLLICKDTTLHTRV